jgi:hypothetical protein
MATEDNRRVTDRPDTRKAGTLASMPRDLFAYACEDDES